MCQERRVLSACRLGPLWFEENSRDPYEIPAQDISLEIDKLDPSAREFDYLKQSLKCGLWFVDERRSLVTKLGPGPTSPAMVGCGCLTFDERGRDRCMHAVEAGPDPRLQLQVSTLLMRRQGEHYHLGKQVFMPVGNGIMS